MVVIGLNESEMHHFIAPKLCEVQETKGMPKVIGFLNNLIVENSFALIVYK